MKLYLDNIVFSLQSAGGISNYWSEITNRLAGSDVDVCFFQQPNSNIFCRDQIYISERESYISPRILRYLPFFKSLPSHSIFHSSYYRTSHRKDILNITTVHDFTYEYFASGLSKWVHVNQKKRAIERSSGIICVSKSTKNDLLKFYPNIDPNIVQVIYNGTSSEFMPLPEGGLRPDELTGISNNPFLLFVGKRSGYKNFSTIIPLLNKETDFSLVVVGGGHFTTEEQKLIDPFKHRIINYQNVNNKSLNWLYNHAFALIYPSLYEGFGIPILEAMKAGCPFIAVNVSSIPEVAGKAGLLINEPNEENFKEQITRLQNPSIYQEQINLGFNQAKKFSWENCFRETLKFYRKILQLNCN